jgi:ribonuclease P protein subunit RPR2
MSRKSRLNKKAQKVIARRRVIRLFTLAEEYALANRLTLANRYVHLARKIAMRYLIPIPNEYKRRFCKHCYHYLVPGANCRVRIHRSTLVTYCKHCHLFTRIPLKNHS